MPTRLPAQFPCRGSPQRQINRLPGVQVMEGSSSNRLSSCIFRISCSTIQLLGACFRMWIRSWIWGEWISRSGWISRPRSIFRPPNSSSAPLVGPGSKVMGVLWPGRYGNPALCAHFFKWLNMYRSAPFSARLGNYTKRNMGMGKETFPSNPIGSTSRQSFSLGSGSGRVRVVSLSYIIHIQQHGTHPYHISPFSTSTSTSTSKLHHKLHHPHKSGENRTTTTQN